MPNGKLPYIPFYTGDWLKDPSVTRCSPATRGIWMDILCAMHNEGTGTIRGNVEGLARISRCSIDEFRAAIEELKVTGTAIVKDENAAYISLTCKRIVRECKHRERNRKNVQNHRLREREGKCKQNVSIASSCSYSDPESEETEFPSSSSVEEEIKIPSTHTHSTSARVSPPAEQAADAAVCVKGSFYSLEDCRKYAESLSGIRNPAGFARTIFRSGSDDQAISDFLASGGRGMTDEEHNAYIARIILERRSAAAKDH